MGFSGVSWSIWGSLFYLWTLHIQSGYCATWAPSVGLNQLPFANSDGWSQDWVRRQAQTVSIERFLRLLLKNYVNNGGSFGTQITDGPTPPTAAWADMGTSVSNSNSLPMITKENPYVEQYTGPSLPTGQLDSALNQLRNDVVPNQLGTGGQTGGQGLQNADQIAKNIFIHNVLNSSHRTTIVVDNKRTSDPMVPNVLPTPFPLAADFVTPTNRTKPLALRRHANGGPKQNVSSAATRVNGSESRLNLELKTAADNKTDAILSKIKFPSLAKMINTIDRKETVNVSTPTKCDKTCPIADVCNNGGTCINTCSGFTCVCPKGFTGFFCDTIENAALEINSTTTVASKTTTVPDSTSSTTTTTTTTTKLPSTTTAATTSKTTETTTTGTTTTKYKHTSSTSTQPTTRTPV